MFSKTLLQLVQCNPQHQSSKADFLNSTLPVEIWDYILQLASGYDLRGLVNCALVSPLFLDICVGICVKSRVVSFVNSQDVVHEDKKLVYSANGQIKLLANDPQGRFYFSCTDEDNNSLLIFNPEIGEESIEINILDALKEAKLTKNEDESTRRNWDYFCELEDYAQIYECIVNTDGFLLILTYFVTYWRFNEQGSPYLCNYSVVSGKGNENTTIYLCGTSDRHYFKQTNALLPYFSIDRELTDKNHFCSTDLNPRSLFWRTHQLGQSTYALGNQDEFLSLYSVTFEGSNLRYELITSIPRKELDKVFYRFPPIFLEYDQYLTLVDRRIVVFCKDTKQLLCLHLEFTELKSHFIVDDTLFMFGEKGGAFLSQVIYLPTNKNITEHFAPYFSPLLSNKCIVWDLKLIHQDEMTFLNVIFENEKSEPGKLYSLKIFNKEIIDTRKLEQSSRLGKTPPEELSEVTPSDTHEPRSHLQSNTPSSQPDVESPTPVSQERPNTSPDEVEDSRREINPPGITMKTPGDREEPTITEKKPLHAVTHLKVSRSFCVPHKLMMFAGIILSFGTAIGTVTLMVFHPGMVIYQGSGLILTLPAVLTLGVGGSVALTILAIGSVRWYQVHKRSFG